MSRTRMRTPLRAASPTRELKRIGYNFPVRQPLPTFSIRIPRSLSVWLNMGVLLGVLIYAQCVIDIPGVDIPDLKDIPGVLEMLEEAGIQPFSLHIMPVLPR